MQIDDWDIVILSKCFSRRMIWKKMVFYIRKTNAIIWYFHLLYQKSKKKSPFWKKLFFPSIPYFSVTAFKWKQTIDYYTRSTLFHTKVSFSLCERVLRTIQGRKVYTIFLGIRMFTFTVFTDQLRLTRISCMHYIQK